MKVINRIETSMFYKKIAHKFQLIFIIVFIISIYDSAAINLSRLDENESDFVEVKSYYKNLIDYQQKTSFSILADKFSNEDLKQRGAEQEYNYKGLENFINDKPLTFVLPDLSNSRNEELVIKDYNSSNLYPNPTKGLITVELLNIDNIKSIEIVNQLGQVVKKLNLFSDKFIFNCTDLPSGIYNLKVDRFNNVDNISFIISK